MTTSVNAEKNVCCKINDGTSADKLLLRRSVRQEENKFATSCVTFFWCVIMHFIIVFQTTRMTFRTTRIYLRHTICTKLFFQHSTDPLQLSTAQMFLFGLGERSNGALRNRHARAHSAPPQSFGVALHYFSARRRHRRRGRNRGRNRRRTIKR